MKAYFRLQFIWTNRRFKDTGFEPLLAYLLLAMVFVGFSIYLFSKTVFAEYIYLLSGLILIGNLSEIRRTEFLKICFGDKKLKKIRVTENLISSGPFLIFLLYKQLFLSAILLLVLATIMALLNYRTTLNYTIWTPFPKRPFEFTTGFRNTYYLFFVAYLLTAVAIIVNNFSLGVFAILLVFASTLSYYTKPENEYYVWSYNINAREFLIGKFKTALLFSASLVMPIAVVLTIFYPQNVGIIMLFFLAGWAFLIFLIVCKYAVYPNEMNIVQALFFALCIWFPPIILVLIPYLFKKSENQLSTLLK